MSQHIAYHTKFLLSEAVLNELGSVSPEARGAAGCDGGSVCVTRSARGSRVTGAYCVCDREPEGQQGIGGSVCVTGSPRVAGCDGDSVCVTGCAMGSRV